MLSLCKVLQYLLTILTIFKMLCPTAYFVERHNGVINVSREENKNIPKSQPPPPLLNEPEARTHSHTHSMSFDPDEEFMTCTTSL